ncbi:MAG: PDZ domain-containing protein [Solirubrobacteraceae bacterium]
MVPASPAAHAGLRPEDLVVAVADQPVHGVDDLQRLMTADRIGQSVELAIFRGGTHRRLALVPRELA